jgi:thiosulfate/3-mercaptopyruvate sulfurtransferase
VSAFPEATDRDRVVVSPAWLDANLGAEGLRVVDVRGKVLPPGNNPRYIPKRADYERGHVPGAVFVDWTTDIVDVKDPIPVQIAQPGAFAEKMAELGIGDRTLVVAYDDYDHAFAGRFAWALRFYGHDDVRLLEGGFPRWVAEGRRTTTELPALSKPTDPFAVRTRAALRRTADEVAHALGDAGVLLIDARAPEQYAGSVSAARRAGHIPGARNVHYARLVDAQTGTFLPAGDLRRVFAEAGVDVENLPHEVVVYCNGAVTCTVPLAALQMLGRSDVAVYDGSWNEWGNDDSRPLTKGPKP